MPKKLKQGTQVAYIPLHAEGDINNPDVEFGFVAVVAQMGYRENDLTYFCKFWAKGKPGTLRTVGNSEACEEDQLVHHTSVDQSIVDKLIAEGKRVPHVKK